MNVRTRWWAVGLAAVACFPASPAAAKTAIQILQESPKPQFRPGHTLLPLTRWGWTMPPEVRVELAEHWGYALEFGGDTTMAVTKALDNPQSLASKMCALAATDPKKYPLCVLTCRPFLDRKFRDTLPPEAWCRDGKGELIKAPGPQLSPEAPDEIFVKAAKLMTDPLVAIRRKAPIAMVLNGGEYGLGVYGWGAKAWQQDPQVLKAKGDRDWFSYISERKAHQEMIISRAVRAAVPDRRLFIFYYTSDCPQRGRNQQWDRWTWDYRAMKTVSDLPNISVYYKEFNSGWTGGDDMLTQVLNCIGGHIAAHEPLSYNWLCSGWAQKNMGPEAFSDAEHYMGFLKCYYTAGMIGGVAGFFSYPQGGFAVDVGDKAPTWLEQEMVLGHAQALFSHVEELIREGDLLPGPARHRWTKDRPAYEFPTGDKDARVVARRHRVRSEWLVTAWATAGPDREVTVEIPDLGKVAILARSCGTVYRATLADGRPSLKLLDKDGMQPTVEGK